MMTYDSIASVTPFKTVYQYFKQERLQWMDQLDRNKREFIEISRSAYVHEFRPLWLKDYQPPWFFNIDCDEREALVNAGLMYRAGNYVLMPSMLWLCQINQTQLSNLSLAKCIRKTSGFRFNLWYGCTHPDFVSLPILPGSPEPTRFESTMTTITSEIQVSPAILSSEPICTFLDLDRNEINHLMDVEQCVRQWLMRVGHWSSSSSKSKSISSFFHIPPQDPPKSTLHLHMVAGKELQLEYNHIFYRVPLSVLNAGEQPSFIVDLTRWRDEQRLPLVDLALRLADMPRVYGIIGCTCSGKSKLSMDLSKRYDTEIVSQDDFFLPDEQLPKLSEKDLLCLPDRWTPKKDIDRNHPSAVDWQKLINHIESLKRTTSKRFILVEGNLLLSQPEVRNMLDRILFIDVPESKKWIIMQRRMSRIRPGCLSEVQMGVTEDEYMPYFDSVWRKYQLHGQPCFQANRLDCEVSTEYAISHLASWFINNIDEKLTNCQKQLNFKSHAI